MIKKLTTIVVFFVGLFSAANSWAFGEGLNRYCIYGGDNWQQKEDSGQYSCVIDTSLQRDHQGIVLYQWLVYGLSVSAYKFDYQAYFNTRSKAEIGDMMLNIELDSQLELTRFLSKLDAKELMIQFEYLDSLAFKPVAEFDELQPKRYSAVKELNYQMQTGQFKGLNVTLMHERSTDQNNTTLFGSYSVRLNTVYNTPKTGYQYRFFSEVLK